MSRKKANFLSSVSLLLLPVGKVFNNTCSCLPTSLLFPFPKHRHRALNVFLKFDGLQKPSLRPEKKNQSISMAGRSECFSVFPHQYIAAAQFFAMFKPAFP